MKKAEVTITGSYRFKYNPKSTEFKEALASYKSMISRSGDVNSMLKHISHNVRQFGSDRMVEGVGYLKVGKREAEAPYSGIELEAGDPDFDYEIN